MRSVVIPLVFLLFPGAILALSSGSNRPQYRTTMAAPSLLSAQKYQCNNNNNMNDHDDESEKWIDDKQQVEGEAKRPSSDPKRTRRKSGSNDKDRYYRTLDDRHALPFLIKLQTPPDPYHYTLRDSRSNGSGSKNESTDDHPSKRDFHHHRKEEDGTILGEFHLPSLTNCGDVIEISDRHYMVQKATCHYRYVGGRRFVMVREVLKVKELSRIHREHYLERQFSLE